MTACDPGSEPRVPGGGVRPAARMCRVPLPSPVVCAVLCSVASALASTAAGAAVSLLLAGTACVIVCGVITVAVSVTAGIVYAAITGRVAAGAAADHTGPGLRGAAMADLPAYSGPGGRCPTCGTGRELT